MYFRLIHRQTEIEILRQRIAAQGLAHGVGEPPLRGEADAALRPRRLQQKRRGGGVVGKQLLDREQPVLLRADRAEYLLRRFNAAKAVVDRLIPQKRKFSYSSSSRRLK